MINNRWSKNNIKIKVDGEYYKVEGMLPHRDKNNNHLRVRNRFKTRTEAEAHLQAMQDKGELYILQGLNRISHLTAKEEADAIAAIKHLQAHGRNITIYEMAVSYVANVKTERPMVRIEEAVKSFTETIKFQENSKHYKVALKGKLLALAKSFPRKEVNQFFRPEIEKWITRKTEGQSATTFNQHYLGLHVFFNYCYNQEWIDENPVSRIQKRRIEKKRIEILDPEEVEKLLEVAINIKDGALVPYLVFSIFCGMRSAEIMRLDWKDVNLSKGVVRVDGKNYRERPVIIPENALVWLNRYAKSEGKVRHNNHTKYWDVLKASAGYRVHSARMSSVCFFGYDEECKNATDKSRPSFPKNVMRHTGITFMVQKLDQNVDKTAIWAGNSPQIIHRHYLAVRGLDDEMTEKFYSILPPEETIFERSA